MVVKCFLAVPTAFGVPTHAFKRHCCAVRAEKLIAEHKKVRLAPEVKVHQFQSSKPRSLCPCTQEQAREYFELTRCRNNVTPRCSLPPLHPDFIKEWHTHKHTNPAPMEQPDSTTATSQQITMLPLLPTA